MTRTMLLIDADNVSTDVMEQAVSALLQEHGALHVRRAYCTAESALKHQSLFKRLGIRPMVNLSAGKNSTDIALAVDALDLVLSERPDVVAIASSDSDFAPLVARLREKGCRVVGIGQQGKTGDATQAAYDAFTVLTHRRAEPAPAPARKTAARRAGTARAADDAPGGSSGGRSGGRAAGAARRSRGAAPAAGSDAPAPAPTAARTSAPASAAVSAPVSAPATAPASTPASTPASASGEAAPAPARKTPRRRTAAARKTAGAAKASAAPAPAPPVPAPAPARAPSAVPDTVRQILTALPELVRGDTVELRVAASRLREAGLLSKSGASTKVFSAYGDRFELLPASNPNKVRLRT